MRSRPRSAAAPTTAGIACLTPYAGTNRIRFYGTLSACAPCGQAPRSAGKPKRNRARGKCILRRNCSVQPLPFVRMPHSLNRVLVLADGPVVAALIGLLVETTGRVPVFAMPDEVASDALE